MPHALSMPAPGLQAIILCGPGSSFPTFTANPDENPKALIPIANRPMLWYPIDFCYRMGITGEVLLVLFMGHDYRDLPYEKVLISMFC
jgi:translation initiation factor eIF-2B subunit gamma